MSRAGLFAVALACACTRAPEAANAPAIPVEAAKDPAPANEAPAEAPTEAKAAPRACEPGERLDTGCECRSGGACFDICCGENADCAHPAEPGGPSACMLKMPASPAPQRACKDGEELASGCRCDGKTCMDICCVGSACSHHASPDGGWAKCVNLPKRGR